MRKLERAPSFCGSSSRSSPRSTLTTRRALGHEVSAIIERGYAIDRSEFEQTLGCCAAAVFDHRGMPIAADQRLGAGRPRPDAHGEGGARRSRATARAISERLGFRGALPGP